jgi:hypothetical protein
MTPAQIEQLTAEFDDLEGQLCRWIQNKLEASFAVRSSHSTNRAQRTWTIVDDALSGGVDSGGWYGCWEFSYIYLYSWYHTTKQRTGRKREYSLLVRDNAFRCFRERSNGQESPSKFGTSSMFNKKNYKNIK